MAQRIQSSSVNVLNPMNSVNRPSATSPPRQLVSAPSQRSGDLAQTSMPARLRQNTRSPTPAAHMASRNITEPQLKTAGCAPAPMGKPLPPTSRAQRVQELEFKIRGGSHKVPMPGGNQLQTKSGGGQVTPQSPPTALPMRRCSPPGRDSLAHTDSSLLRPQGITKGGSLEVPPPFRMFSFEASQSPVLPSRSSLQPSVQETTAPSSCLVAALEEPNSSEQHAAQNSDAAKKEIVQLGGSDSVPTGLPKATPRLGSQGPPKTTPRLGSQIVVAPPKEASSVDPEVLAAGAVPPLAGAVAKEQPSLDGVVGRQPRTQSKRSITLSEDGSIEISPQPLSSPPVSNVSYTSEQWKAFQELEQAEMLCEFRRLEIALAEERSRNKQLQKIFAVELMAQKDAHSRDVMALEDMVGKVINENKRLSSMVERFCGKAAADPMLSSPPRNRSPEKHSSVVMHRGISDAEVSTESEHIVSSSSEDSPAEKTTFPWLASASFDERAAASKPRRPRDRPLYTTVD